MATPNSAPPAYSTAPPPSYEAALSRTVSRPFSIRSPSTGFSTPNASTRRPSGLFGRSASRNANSGGSIAEENGSDETAYVDPVTLLPTSFSVGKQTVSPPFVGLDEVKDHLLLLAALHKLQNQVRQSALDSFVTESAHSPINPDLALSAYSTLSAHQFEQWVQEGGRRGSINGSQEWRGEDLPKSLGVVGVWHAFVLNPRWYYEDTAIRPEFRFLGERGSSRFPLRLICRYINPDTLEYKPPSAKGPAPSPCIADLLSADIPLSCPQCPQTLSVPLLRPPPNLDGLVQTAFQTTCPHCQFHITPPILLATKFLSDCRRIVTGQLFFLPGMRLRPSNGRATDDRARLFSQLIGKMFVPGFDVAENRLFPRKAKGGGVFEEGTKQEVVWANMAKDVPAYGEEELRARAGTSGLPRNLDEHVAALSARPDFKGKDLFSLSTYHAAVDAALSSKRFHLWVGSFRIGVDEFPPRLGRMWNAYRSSGMSSVDLAGAFQRQADFVGRMAGLGWLEKGYFEREEKVFLLQKAVARYHAFLDLNSGFKAGALCPTLDIDLIWHTHQLHIMSYQIDTIKYTTRFLDHEDTITEQRLADSYEANSQAWLKRFGVPYSSCGCHQGDEIGAALGDQGGSSGSSKMRMFGIGKGKDKESPLEKRKRSIFETDRQLTEEERLATHPSTHNILKIAGIADLERVRSDRRRRMSDLDRKGRKMSSSSVDFESVFAKRPDHSDPFVYNPASVMDDDKRTSAEKKNESLDRMVVGSGMGLGSGGAGGAAVWGMPETDCHELIIDHEGDGVGSGANGWIYQAILGAVTPENSSGASYGKAMGVVMGDFV